MKKNGFQFVLLAAALALYFLVLRIAFARLPGYSLMSVSFFFLTPFVAGLALESVWRRMGRSFSLQTLWVPSVGFIGFGLATIAAGLESLFCLFIMALPFILVALLGVVVALVIRSIILRYRSQQKRTQTQDFILKSREIEEEERDKHRKQYEAEEAERKRKMEELAMVPLLLLAPFFLGGLENSANAPLQTFHTQSSIEIAATPQDVWPKIIRVSPIKETEMPSGFFHSMGIPRPLFAELDGEGLGGKRVGHFEEGLRLVETVTHWDKDKRFDLSVKIDPRSVGNAVFDQHVLKGNYFFIRSAGYELQPLPNGNTLLTLHSSYQLRSNFNFYPKMWGDWALDDFQNRLLKVIKSRAENRNSILADQK